MAGTANIGGNRKFPLANGTANSVRDDAVGQLSRMM
jgi:hypothetical protein